MAMKKLMLSLVAACAAAVGAQGATIDEMSFAYKAELTVAGYSGASEVKDLPVLVRLAEGAPVGFSYATCDKDSLRFADASGNLIPHEIDTWNAEGESLVWVKIPAVSGADTKFKMYYGGMGAFTERLSVGEVWSNYAAVWHLNEGGTDGGTTDPVIVKNSSANGEDLDGEAYGGTTAAEGAIGGARHIYPGTSGKGGIWATGSLPCTNFKGTMTVSAWLLHDNAACSWDHIFYKREKSGGSGGLAIELNNNSTSADVRGGNSTSLSTGNFSKLKTEWTYIAFAYSGTSCTVYENGLTKKTGTVGTVTDNLDRWCFGNCTKGYQGATGDSPWRGSMDEIRLSGVAQSADYAAAEYGAMTNGFLSCGEVESISAKAWGNVAAGDGKAVVSGLIADTTENGPFTAKFGYVAQGGEIPALTPIAEGVASGENWTVTVSGLANGTTYDYQLVIVDQGGAEVFSRTGTIFPRPVISLLDVPVWVSGLQQARFNVAFDKTSDASASTINVEVVPGSVMADLYVGSDSAASTTPYTNPFTGTKYYYYSQNTTFAYFGQVWMTAGDKVNFTKNIDDSGYVKIDDNVVLDNGGYQDYIVRTYEVSETGWHAIDLRCGDGSGGKGPSGGKVGKSIGLGYNINGITTVTSPDGWSTIRDAGNDALFLRTAEPNGLSLMGMGIYDKSGDDAIVWLSFANVPVEAELRAYYDVEDRGDSPNGWSGYVSVATIPAGETLPLPYVAEGVAVNGAVRMALVVPGSETQQGMYQFSPVISFGGQTTPSISVAEKDIRYTDGDVTVTLNSFGMGASSAAVSLELADNEEMENARTIDLGTWDTLKSEVVTVGELTTNSVYYFRAQATNQNGTGRSAVLSVLTLTPTEPAGSFLLKSNASTAQAFLATVTDLGDDSHSAVITMQCATDEDFTEGLCESDPLDIGEDDLDVEKELIVPGLQKNTPYYSRLKIVNAWGLVYYAETFFCPTYDSLVVQGIGYTAVDGGFDVDVVVSYMDGDSATVELFANGVSLGTQDLTAAGSASFAVTSAADLTTLRAVVTGEATVEKTVSAKKGTTQVVVDTLAGHDTADTAFVFDVGDKIVLPAPLGNASYKNLSGHRFLGIENNVVTAFEPGFGVIEQYDVDGSYLGKAVVFIKPDMQAGGRVFVYDFKVNKGWADAGSWVQVGANSRESVPGDPKDVVFVLMTSAKDQEFKVAGEQSVQDIYFGNPFDASTSFRFSGNAATGCRLNVYGIPEGKKARPGTFMVATVGTTAANRMENFSFGGSGSGTAVTLGCAGDVNFDLGGRSSNPNFENSNNGIIRMQNDYGFIDIPEGRRLSCVNGHSMSGSFSDGQPWNEHCWTFSHADAVTGKGVFEIAASGEFYLTGTAFSAFEGEIVDSMRNVVTKFSADRSGPCWSALHDMPNATLTIAGYVPADFDIKKSVGVFTQGNNGWGASAFVGNGIPYHGVNLDGGYLRFHKYQSYAGTPIYAPDGETIVDYEVYNQTANLNVRSGMTYVYIRDSPGTGEVMRRFTTESVTHDGSGSLIVQDARTWEGNTTARSFMELGDISNLYVGNTADVDLANDVFPVVPWLMTYWGDSSPWWGYVGADGIMCRGGVRTNTNLSDVADSRRNVLIHSKAIAIAADTTVNSLVLSDLKGQSLAGHQLAISSGGLILRGSSGLGTADGGESNGSVVFPERAYVWSLTTSASSPSAIWSPIAAPKGVVAAGAGYLRLGGDQTGIDGDITVNGGQFELGDTSGHGCQIDVPINLVGGNTKLVVNQTDTIKDLTLNLSCPGGYGPKITVPAAGEKCFKLYVDGQSLPRGTYGAVGSGAQFESEYIAAGSGVLTVRKDDITRGLKLILR